MARPERYTVEQVIDAIQQAQTAAGAARILGCTPNTVRAYAERYKSIDRALREERRNLLDYAEMSLKRAVLNGEAWAVALTVKTLGKEHYSERTEITGADAGPLVINLSWGDGDDSG